MLRVSSALCLFLAGCGVPLDTPLGDVTSDQWSQICGYRVDAIDGRTVTCESGDVEVPAWDVDACVAQGESYTAAACEATLQDWVDCDDEGAITDEQACGGVTLSDACTLVAACVGG